jgi:hypothetical protein
MKTGKRYDPFPLSICLIIAVLVNYACFSQAGSLQITDKLTRTSFPLIDDGVIPSFYYDKTDATVVRIAAEAFASDLAAITGKKMSIVTEKNHTTDFTIVAGTIGHSAWIDELVRAKSIDASAIKHKWEAFSIRIIHGPDKKLLVIAGSDRRGTAYGILHLSRVMGVSPFVWWADVAPAKRTGLFISGSYISSSPSVKYRGLFINDEDWGLQPWAAQHMDTTIKDIGPNTYAKVFELMLRLKANYIWPAMHPCTKAFYYYKENPKVADDYAIIVGGSHCEPMLRNNVFEWAENFEHEYGKKPGDWRYDLNKEEIHKYWDDRVKEAVDYESVYTVGMRGIHDGSMPGPKDPAEKLRLLESVIIDQRKILNTNFSKPASEVPQIFVPYKEVLSLYRRGLKLPDDVTIIWPDDNHGYIRQLPNDQERKRSGGHGVYYHLSYWGAPQDYLWLSSISPPLISYEMSKAYDYGADKLWVFNVGDIKPAELELQFAMDMAWDITKWTPEKAHTYTRVWAKEIFGETLADEIAGIKNEYYLLANSGKPEHMNAVAFTFLQIKDRLEKYTTLLTKAETIYKKIAPGLRDAYYQLVLYPVCGAKLMNDKILRTKLSFHHYPNNKFEPVYQAGLARKAFASIDSVTFIYNHSIASGKWKGIMSWHPRDLPVFKMPLAADSASVSKKDSLQKAYFSAKDPQLVLAASAFSGKKETAATQIAQVEGLGINGRGITRISKSNRRDNDSMPLYTDYQFSLPRGTYTIEIKCLPVFDVIASKNLRYAISVDNGTVHAINVHAEADSKEWRENVLRGYSSGKTLITMEGTKHKLRLWLKDPNLVINTIEFYKHNDQ